MLDNDVIGNRFAASECMNYNYIKRNFMTTLTMDPLLANIMGFYFLPVNEVQKYIDRRLELYNKLQIGIVNNSAEVLPVQTGQG
jgi:hypothetical protein